MDTVYFCYCKCRLVTPPMVGAEGMKISDFDNPRLLEETLSGKDLHRKLLLFTKKILKVQKLFLKNVENTLCYALFCLF